MAGFPGHGGIDEVKLTGRRKRAKDGRVSREYECKAPTQGGPQRCRYVGWSVHLDLVELESAVSRLADLGRGP